MQVAVECADFVFPGSLLQEMTYW